MKHSVKWLLLIAFLFTTVNIQAQMEARNGFKEGYKSIQFGIGNNFRLSTFGGSNLSMMKYTSEEEALFLRFSFNSQFQFLGTTQETTSTTPDDVTASSETELENSEFTTNLKLTVGKQSYIKSDSDVLPFITKSLFIGSYLQLENDNGTNTVSDGSNTNTDEIDTKGNQFSPFMGVGLGIGVEYFVAKNISLTAQTGFELQYTFEANDYNRERNRQYASGITILDTNTSNGSYHGIGLLPITVIFGVSAYF